MLSDKQINKLNNLLDDNTELFEKHPQLIKIVLDAINTWRSEIDPINGSWGVFLNENNIYNCKYKKCCLLGAALCGKKGEVTGTIYSWFCDISDIFHVSRGQVDSILQGFDYDAAREDEDPPKIPEIFIFVKKLALIVLSDKN